MWKIILRRLGVLQVNSLYDEDIIRLLEKTRIVLNRSTTLTHLRVSKKLLRECETMLQLHQYPLEFVEQYDELLRLWELRFKIWKRG